MAIPEEIQTARLNLKRSTVNHAPAIFEAYATDTAVTKYMSWKPYTDEGQVEDFIDSLSKGWEAGTEFAWCIFDKTDNQLMGMINLRIDSFKANGGYVLAQPHWGHGYMTEALVAIRELAFSLPEIERFQMECDVDNPASARVMEKAGFEKEGVLRRYIRHPNVSDVPRDCFCYSFVR